MHKAMPRAICGVIFSPKKTAASSMPNSGELEVSVTTLAGLACVIA
jgi:hypothetical protein